MSFPKELKYTKTHEWAKKTDKNITVGITDYAQKEISDVVFVELPKVGDTATAGKPIAVVESVKAAFDIYAPVSGTITKVNGVLESDPGKVNQDCYGEGWFFELEAADTSQWEALMSSGDYDSHLKQETK